MNKERCFICGNIVLGLRGQDLYLDTYFLQGDDSDILDNNAFGECHVKCLHSFRCRSLWRKRIIENFIYSRKFKPVESSLIGHDVLWNPGMKEFVVVDPGSSFRFVGVRSLHEWKSVGAIYLRTIEEMLRVDLSGSVTLLEEVLQRGVLGGEGFPLIAMIDRLSIRQHILSLEAVEEGLLWVQDTEETTLFMTAKYSEFLPADVYSDLERLSKEGLS